MNNNICHFVLVFLALVLSGQLKPFNGNANSIRKVCLLMWVDGSDNAHLQSATLSLSLTDTHTHTQTHTLTHSHTNAQCHPSGHMSHRDKLTVDKRAADPRLPCISVDFVSGWSGMCRRIALTWLRAYLGIEGKVMILWVFVLLINPGEGLQRAAVWNAAAIWHAATVGHQKCTCQELGGLIASL